MTRSHGSVRGLDHVNRSSLSGARFGRMFRSLPGEVYEKAHLVELAKTIVQLETAHFRTTGDLPLPDKEKVEEGPDVAFATVPFQRTPPDGNTLLDTAYTVAEPGDENPAIPAGYTYFGQFIDHDLTFDPNSSLQKQNDPDATEDFRTPRLDLDSLYGRGPDDQPYLYQDSQAAGGGIRFLLGRSAVDPSIVRPGELPRNVEGRSLTGDPRNDENNLVCQLQAVFLNFHNRVIDVLQTARPKLNPHQLFVEAQRIVRWHYQYIVLNDYLPRVVGSCTWNEVFGRGGAGHPVPKLRFYKPKNGQAYMPVEFSIAAFRFGHSMVRPSYALRAHDARVGGSPTAPFAGDDRFHRIPIFSIPRDAGPRVRTASLDGFGPLPQAWEIDWDMFFAAGDMPVRASKEMQGGRPILGVLPQDANHKTQPGYRIDTQLVDPLAMLPPNVAKSGNMPDGIPTLAYRNLLRGSAFALPSGQSVARALQLRVMTEAELWGDRPAIGGTIDFRNPRDNPFTHRAPLWYYILKEAEGVRKKGLEADGKGGHHLGPVGGHIVAEVLVGVALNDHGSYLNSDIGWTPASERTRSGFDPGVPITTMYHLIHWTTGGTMTFLPDPAAMPAAPMPSQP